MALELLRKGGGRAPSTADRRRIGEVLDEAAEDAGVTEFSPYFLRTEWSRVIVAQGIETLGAVPLRTPGWPGRSAARQANVTRSVGRLRGDSAAVD